MLQNSIDSCVQIAASVVPLTSAACSAVLQLPCIDVRFLWDEAQLRSFKRSDSFGLYTSTFALDSAGFPA